MATTCFINARFLTQSMTGVQRTATETIKALDEILEITPAIMDQFQFTMLVPRNVKHDLKLKNIPMSMVGRLSGHPWEQFELPWYSRRGILVSLCNTAPLVKHQQIVMIHDASCFVSPETYSFAFRSWYRLLHPSLGLVCRRVMTVSEFSASELEKHAHINPQKIAVVYNGGEHITAEDPDYSILKKLENRSRPFILAVSSMSPNKNFRSLIKAMEHISHRTFDVVIAGGTNPRIFREQNIQISETMKYLGYVSDSQLRALYENAMGFIYPSTYEGFGLPPLEAMTCGCPVIASDIPPLKEVCGEAALYCDPNEPADIARKMVQLAEDKAMRNDLVSKGAERAKRFTWRKAAEGFLRQLSILTGQPMPTIELERQRRSMPTVDSKRT